MARLVLQQITKQFPLNARNPFPALTDLTLAVEPGECLGVVGPTGSGKSTLLRIIAGLETPTSGQLRLNDQEITSVPPEKRDVAMVFQGGALLPHLAVRDNLTLGLQIRRVSSAEIARRLGEMAALLELDPLLDRFPAELSGGEHQRVALGRAFMRESSVLLLDEPMNGLDPLSRRQLRRYLQTLRRRFQATLIYVTHDHEEAMLSADRLAILRRGQLQQCATPDAIYQQPANPFVAQFFGRFGMNFWTGTLLPAAGGDTGFVFQPNAPTVDGTTFSLPLEAVPKSLRVAGNKLILGLRPEQGQVHPGPRTVDPSNRSVDLPATLSSTFSTGPETFAEGQCCGATVVGRVDAACLPAFPSEGYLRFFWKDTHWFHASADLAGAAPA